MWDNHILPNPILKNKQIKSLFLQKKKKTKKMQVDSYLLK